MSPKDNPTDEPPEVLIVESSPTQALKLRHLLAQQGFQGASARNAREALTALDVRTPFLVLSDAVLPETDGYELCRRIKARPELSHVLVVLMVSLSDPQAIFNVLECGADNVLPKPVEDDALTARLNDIWATEKLRRRSDSTGALTVVFEGEERALAPERERERLDILLSLFEIGSRRERMLRDLRETVERQGEARRETAPAVPTPPPTAPITPVAGLRILLAEDSDVNQRLGVRTLEKHGHRVVVAADGRQALVALAHQSFDLILMDVEMPELNGLDATTAIREQEKTSGAHIAIIAMTAHTDPETRERCLSAGMDECVSKPLQMETLAPLLPKQATAPAQSSHPAAAVWDRAAALATVEGDTELLGEIIGLFLEEAPRLLESARDAAARQDGQALERAAHSLKGSAASLGAGTVVAAALTLETLGRAGQTAQVQEALSTLEAALAGLTLRIADQAE